MTKINGMDFLIGADPEFFVKRFNKLTSAYGLIPGTKDDPFKVNHGAVQVDGMALEFNIDPAKNFREFDTNITSVLDTITKMVPGYEPFIQPVADFGADYIEAQPPVAKDLGCSPDFNAYTRLQNPRPDVNAPFRTASGHVHIGWTSGVAPDDPGHLEACYALVKALDVWLGIPSLAWSEDNRRRTLYGKAGSFRPKSYGLEYRVLDNTWISKPEYRQLVYFNTLEAIKMTFKNPDFTKELDFEGVKVREVVDQSVINWEEAAVYFLEVAQIRYAAGYRNKAYSLE